MALVVEDGSGVEGAESYLSVADFMTYAAARGRSLLGKTDEQIEQALRRGVRFIDTRYRAQWPGVRAFGREQALAWPRSSAVDGDGEDIADDELPAEVVDASAEAALRELAAPGSLSPDLPRGGAIKRKRVKAGPVETETEYADGASGETTFAAIDDLLGNLLVARTSTTVSSLMRA